MPHHLLPNIIRFGRLLRAAGIPVTPQQIGDLVEGLEYIDLSRRGDVKNVARATLVNRREHLALFDRAFDLFWRPHTPATRESSDGLSQMDRQERSRRGEALLETGGSATPTDDLDPSFDTLYTYSAIETLHQKDFAALTPEELDDIKRLIQAMAWNLEQRRTRRKIPAANGAYLDWRRTLRQNLRYGGEPMRLARRSRKRKPRPLVVLCDVSGSMEQYSRILLQFLYAISHGLRGVETFVFSTRLTRITPMLQRRTIDAALDEVTAQAQDMGGGTQIGGALKAFNYRWARRVLGRGAIVLLISDGWDRGAPEEMNAQMQRLQLNAHRLIWLNPLLGSPTYEPLTRGMQAALPFIDDFLPVHNLHSLEQLGRLLENIDEHRRTLTIRR